MAAAVVLMSHTQICHRMLMNFGSLNVGIVTAAKATNTDVSVVPKRVSDLANVPLRQDLLQQQVFPRRQLPGNRRLLDQELVVGADTIHMDDLVVAEEPRCVGFLRAPGDAVSVTVVAFLMAK